jgi:hypothetical protein
MSDIEKGMVFESLLHGGLGVYHDQMVRRSRFAGFDRGRFTRALELLVAKHEILRTGFNLSDYGTPVQLVYRQVPVALHYEDLAALPHSAQETTIQAFAREEMQRPFDVARAPLWRMAAFHLGHDELLFLFQCHHAIIDGWSDALLLTELNNLYLELGDHPGYAPAKLKASYRDFIVQHETDKRDDRIRAFWTQELAGCKRLDLFTDEEDGVLYGKALDPARFRQLEGLARELGTTVKAISLAAYVYLLKLLNYDPEVVAGLVTNTRPACEDGDKVLGCFLNTIPFRITLAESTPFDALVAEVHAKLIGLKGHEGLSLAGIAALHPQPAGAGNAFFDTFFNYVDFHSYRSLRREAPAPGEPAPADVRVKGTGTTNTFLDFTVNATGDLYTAGLFLRKKLKSGHSAEALVDLYFNILYRVLEAPRTALGGLDCLPAAERQQLLDGFNDTTGRLSGRPVDHRPVRSAGRADARRRGPGERRRVAYLPATRRAVGLPGRLPAVEVPPGGRRPGGRAAAAERVAGDRPAGRPQSGRRVRARRPGPSRRTHPLHPGRQRLQGTPRRGRTGRIPAPVGRLRRQAAPRGRVVAPGLRALHVGFYGPAQGLHAGAPGRGEPALLDVATLRVQPGRRGAAKNHLHLRRVGVGAFPTAVLGRPAGGVPQRRRRFARAAGGPGGAPRRYVHALRARHAQRVCGRPAGIAGTADRLNSLRLVVASGEALPAETVRAWYGQTAIPLHNLYGPTEASVDVTSYATGPHDRSIPIGPPGLEYPDLHCEPPQPAPAGRAPAKSASAVSNWPAATTGGPS